MISRSYATSNAAIANPIITTFPPNGSNRTQRVMPRGTPALTGGRNLPHDLRQHRQLAATMTRKTKQPTKHNGAILSLDVAIGLVNIGKEASSMTPAPAVFGVVAILLTTIRVGFIPLRERDTPGSIIVRTRWPTNRIAWTSGYSALMSVMRLGGERMERG